jgi:hypothetical protein
MREFKATYEADSVGQARPRHDTNIATQSTGTTLNTNVSGNFTDGYPAGTYSATGLPTGGSIAAATGIITGTATPGTYNTCQVTLENAFGVAISNVFSWTVT